MRRAAVLVLTALLLPAAAAAQNSVYGLVGPGFPGEPVGVRARGLGGGVAAFDPASALNPATVASFGRLAATVSVGTTFRRYTAGDSAVSGLRETRYPFGLFGGRLGRTPVSFALSYASYLERSYDITTVRPQVLRGDTIPVTDRIRSDGGVVDLRGALAVRLSSALSLGGAVHLLSGSSRILAQRTFSDSAYLSYAEHSELQFSGSGASGGVLVRPVPAVELAGYARVNGRLTSRVGPDTVSLVRLPVTLGGGLRLQPSRGLGWSITATRQSWSRSQPDLAVSTRAFNTWELASGVEISRLVAWPRGTGMPLRLGVRYRQLPFSNVATQPSELLLAGGTGLVLARGRATLDWSLEHLRRSGGGATERAWQISVGVMVVP